MWGQGLARGYKFADEVRRQVDLDLGPRSASEPYIFAHSGATVAEHDKDSNFDVANVPPELADLEPPQELPLSYPSIPKQLEMAKSWLTARGIGHDQVDLVLLNGGINDVGGLKIFDPSVNPDWVRERTRQKVEPMMEFLPEVLTTFSKAKVTIPNYFQIVSTDTGIWELSALLSAFFLSPLPAVELPIIRNQLDKQSDAFNLEWTERMSSIIEELRTTRPELAERICLVDVQFSGTNAYSAPDTYLWKIVQMDGWFYTRDQLEDDRIRDCEDAENHDWRPPDTPPYCKVAAAFHPNVAGANRYRDAMMSCIRSRGWIEEWRGGPWTWTYEEITASMEPPLGEGTDRQDQWTGKISAKELQPPHYPVRGMVVIYRNNLEVKRVPTDTEFSWTFAQRIIIDKEPYIRDDRVVVQAPYASPFVLQAGGTRPFDV